MSVWMQPVDGEIVEGIRREERKLIAGKIRRMANDGPWRAMVIGETTSEPMMVACDSLLAAASRIEAGD